MSRIASIVLGAAGAGITFFLGAVPSSSVNIDPMVTLALGTAGACINFVLSQLSVADK